MVILRMDMMDSIGFGLARRSHDGWDVASLRSRMVRGIAEWWLSVSE